MDGKRFGTDGPFTETREQLGGYFLIDAQDLDAAIAIAGRIPSDCKSTVEIRPVLELLGLLSTSCRSDRDRATQITIAALTQIL